MKRKNLKCTNISRNFDHQVIILSKLLYVKALKDFRIVYLHKQIQMVIVYQKQVFKINDIQLQIIIESDLKNKIKMSLKAKKSPHITKIFSI